jgi:hypothetical protein
MENIDKSIDKPKKQHGGYRPGAGRPKGRTDTITIAGLLDQVHQQSGGRDYHEILVGDFLQARNAGDTQLTLKYHNLILNKVMNTLAKIEVTDSADAVAQKQAAFTEALAKLTGMTPE